MPGGRGQERKKAKQFLLVLKSTVGAWPRWSLLPSVENKKINKQTTQRFSNNKKK